MNNTGYNTHTPEPFEGPPHAASSPLSSPPASSPLRPTLTRQHSEYLFGSSPLSSPVTHGGSPGVLRWAPGLPAIAEVPEDDEQDEADEESEPHLEVEALKDALKYLKSRGLTWGDLVEYVSDPDNNEGDTRYEGFFKDQARVRRVLNFWTGWRNSNTGKNTVHAWATEYFRKKVVSEARASTRDGFLQSRLKPIDKTFISGFSMSNIYNRINTLCPTFLNLVLVFCTTAKQQRSMSARGLWRKQIVSLPPCLPSLSVLTDCGFSEQPL